MRPRRGAHGRRRGVPRPPQVARPPLRRHERIPPMNRRGLAAGGHIQDSVSVDGLDHWGSEACWVGIAVAAENALTDSQRAVADKANSHVEILSWKWTRRSDGPAGRNPVHFAASMPHWVRVRATPAIAIEQGACPMFPGFGGVSIDGRRRKRSRSVSRRSEPGRVAARKAWEVGGPVDAHAVCRDSGVTVRALPLHLGHPGLPVRRDAFRSGEQRFQA